MKYIDDYEVCPKCGHDWSAHFAFLDDEGNFLDEPQPSDCMECSPPLCTFAHEPAETETAILTNGERLSWNKI